MGGHTDGAGSDLVILGIKGMGELRQPPPVRVLQLQTKSEDFG